LVAHCVDLFPFSHEASIAYSNIQQIKQELAPQILDATVEALKPVQARISTAVLTGYPGKAIIEAAQENEVDLIVMGTRGLKGIKSFLLGSTTRTVAIQSPEPVLIIHPNQWQHQGMLRVLFATDGSDESQRTMNLLAKLPLPEETELTIINIVLPAIVDIPHQYMAEFGARLEEIINHSREIGQIQSEKLLQEVHKHLGQQFKTIQVKTRFGDPSMEILEAAKAVQADIIALGSRGLRGIKGMLGSVSRNILGHAECSILIGKGEIEHLS
jgi:nucleotide-binding universal stress UspA family protein